MAFTWINCDYYDVRFDQCMINHYKCLRNQCPYYIRKEPDIEEIIKNIERRTKRSKKNSKRTDERNDNR